jgi:type VI secretion system protein ImpK
MERANEVVHDYLNALSQVRRARGTRPMPEVIHGRLCSFLERAMRQADERGFNQQDVRDIGYVLAALGDEVVLSMDAELRDYWLPRMLQLKYFNENVAGEGVFQRIDALLGEGHRAEVLLVYYYALLFGFQGRFRIRGGELELQNVTERVAATLQRSGRIKETDLSPHGERPKDEGSRIRRNLPLVAASIVILLVAIGVYVGLDVSVSGDADALVEQVSSSQGA